MLECARAAHSFFVDSRVSKELQSESGFSSLLGSSSLKSVCPAGVSKRTSICAAELAEKETASWQEAGRLCVGVRCKLDEAPKKKHTDGGLLCVNNSFPPLVYPGGKAYKRNSRAHASFGLLVDGSRNGNTVTI